MKPKFLLAFGLIALAIFLLGCITNENNNGAVCAQVITFGVDSAGNCAEYPTSCLPEGITKVDSCPDSCENVQCADKCSGTTRLSNGICQNGECVYETTKANSTKCGYKNFNLETEAILRYCNYSAYFDQYTFFLSVKNLGNESPKPGSSVWLVSPEITKKVYQPINFTYNREIFWWQEVFTEKSYRGQTFEIFNELEFKDFDYKFIYCELQNNDTDICSEENGLVLYSGNTMADCNRVT